MNQISANFHTIEAYIGPGAGRQVVAGVPVRGPEAYQSALSNVAEMEHILHTSGDPVTALRDYEYFKYVERYCEAARNSGIEDSRTELIERLANHLYRSNRDANGATSHTYTNPAVQEDVHARSQVRVTDLAQSGGRPSEVTDEYLQSSFDIIQSYIDDTIPQIRDLSMADPSVHVASPPPRSR